MWVWGCEDVRMWGCDICAGLRERPGRGLPVGKCEGVMIWRCEDVKMWGCEDVRVWRCDDVRVWRCDMCRPTGETWPRPTSGGMWGCEDVRVWWCEGVRMWGCDDVRVWWCEGVRMWWCEGVMMWGCEGVRMWGCDMCRPTGGIWQRPTSGGRSSRVLGMWRSWLRPGNYTTTSSDASPNSCPRSAPPVQFTNPLYHLSPTFLPLFPSTSSTPPFLLHFSHQFLTSFLFPSSCFVSIPTLLFLPLLLCPAFPLHSLFLYHSLPLTYPSLSLPLPSFPSLSLPPILPPSLLPSLSPSLSTSSPPFYPSLLSLFIFHYPLLYLPLPPSLPPSQLTTLELQYVSPKLMGCENLELAVPGTYEPNQPIVHIRKVSATLNVITSKQRPRKLVIQGEETRSFVVEELVFLGRKSGHDYVHVYVCSLYIRTYIHVRTCILWY